MSISRYRRQLKVGHWENLRWLRGMSANYFTWDGAARLWVDMAKDFRDSFSKYKTFWHLLRDFLQPFDGLYNLGMGLASLVLIPTAIFFKVTFELILAFMTDMKYVKDVLSQAAYHLLNWPLNVVSYLARGLTQLLTTPLTWLLRIPFRGLGTMIFGWPSMEENRGVQRLVAEGEALLAQAENAGTASRFHSVIFQLMRKTQIARAWGQVEKPHPAAVEDFTKLEGPELSFKLQVDDKVPAPVGTSTYMVKRTLLIEVPQVNQLAALNADDLVKRYQQTLEEAIRKDKDPSLAVGGFSEYALEVEVAGEKKAVIMRPSTSLLKADEAHPPGRAADDMSFSYQGRAMMNPYRFVGNTSNDAIVDNTDKDKDQKLAKLQSYLNLHKP